MTVLFSEILRRYAPQDDKKGYVARSAFSPVTLSEAAKV